MFTTTELLPGLYFKRDESDQQIMRLEVGPIFVPAPGSIKDLFTNIVPSPVEFKHLGIAIAKESNIIARETRRGVANIVLVNPDSIDQVADKFINNPVQTVVPWDDVPTDEVWLTYWQTRDDEKVIDGVFQSVDGQLFISDKAPVSDYCTRLVITPDWDEMHLIEKANYLRDKTNAGLMECKKAAITATSIEDALHIIFNTLHSQRPACITYKSPLHK